MATLFHAPLNSTRSPLFHGAAPLSPCEAFSFCKHNEQRSPISYLKQTSLWKLSAMAAAAAQVKLESEHIFSKEEAEHQTKKDGMLARSLRWCRVVSIENFGKRRPTAVTIIGKHLVVWWDRDGKSWHVWEDECPHQLAPLSEGRINKKGELQCACHGWRFAPCSGAPTPLNGASRSQMEDTESKAALVTDTVDLTEPIDNSHEELCTAPQEDLNDHFTDVLNTSFEVLDMDNSAVAGAGLVPYHDGWPTSFSVLSGGGQLVADLTTAWDGLAGRLSPSITSRKHMEQILVALKLAFTAFNRAPEDVRVMLVNSLSIAYTLADLQLEATVVAAGLLRLAVEVGLLRISQVDQQLGSGVGRLLHDCMRFKRTLDQMDLFDEESAKRVRQFCLSYYDIRSITVEFSYRLQQMRHAHDLPIHQQQVLALESLQIHAPLAHAIGTKEVSNELEDLAFKVVLSDSYKFLDDWLQRHWPDENLVLEKCKRQLYSALEHDEKLKALTDSFTILGRFKSRFSIMKKLVKDGRKPEEVYDVVGFRVVVSPKSSYDGSKSIEGGRIACYRVLEIVRLLWKEVPGRLKDYIANPKSNGYESLHMAVYIANSSSTLLTMELQVRTSTMDFKANDGEASHSFYKGGLTDLEQVQQLKKLMMAAADRAASSLKELSGDASLSNASLSNAAASEDQVFLLFDKNKDGEISMCELEQVMGDLGVDGKEAHELMQLVDTNKDGSVSLDEFTEFKKQISYLRGFDKSFSNKLRCRLKYSDAGSAQESRCLQQSE